jgi:hypothetical protein
MFAVGRAVPDADDFNIIHWREEPGNYPELRDEPPEQAKVLHDRALLATKPTRWFWTRWFIAYLACIILVITPLTILIETRLNLRESGARTGLFLNIITLLAFFSYLVVHRRRQMRPYFRQHLPRRCPACGYNLTANTSGRCPECGQTIAGDKAG